MSRLDTAYDPDPLQEGDRVRVRLSGECPAHSDPALAFLDGAPGRVAADPGGFTGERHPLFVEFTPRILVEDDPAGFGSYFGAALCRSEVERL